MQGMIAEYEREKIMERSRRGMIHAAKQGSINVLGKAPYGYRYIDKYSGGGVARYEIVEEEAIVARQIFSWVGYDRLSIGAVCRRLGEMKLPSPTKQAYWGKSTVCAILKNPTYKGLAAFGKCKIGNKINRVRPAKNSCEQPKNHYSKSISPKENWIYIPVPALIDEALFDAVQEQLEENKKISRARLREVRYLLQGLVLCGQCHYACYGRPLSENEIKKRGERAKNYSYYRCSGTDANRFGGNKICNNKPVRLDALDMAVWEEVKNLLKNPKCLLKEYQRRISELDKSPYDQENILLEQQELKLQRGIARLIDSYAQEYISKEEFEPRVQAMKQRLKLITEQKNKITDQKKLKNELTLIVTNLESFSFSVESKLDNIDWVTKRDIIRTLVKRVEVNNEDVNVVFRINTLFDDRTSSSEDQKYLQHRPARNRLIYR
jgi:site-specific DNA recombinase